MSLSNIKVNDSTVTGVDEQPTAGSDNLVKSGGVQKYGIEFLSDISKIITQETEFTPSFPYIHAAILQGHKYIIHFDSPTDCTYTLRVTQNTILVQTIGSFTNSQYVTFTAEGNGNYINVLGLVSSVTTDKKVSVYEIVGIDEELQNAVNGKVIFSGSNVFNGTSAYNITGLKSNVLYEIELSCTDNFNLQLNYLNTSTKYIAIGIVNNVGNKYKFVLPNDLSQDGRITLYHGDSSSQTIGISLKEYGINSIDVFNLENDVVNGNILYDTYHAFDGVSTLDISNVEKYVLYNLELSCDETFNVDLLYFNNNGQYTHLAYFSNENNKTSFRLPDDLNQIRKITLYHGDDSNQIIFIKLKQEGVKNDLKSLSDRVLRIPVNNRKVLTVKKDGTGDFTSIYSAMISIGKNSPLDRYEIQIFDDFDFTESDIQGREVFPTKPYVDLRGMNGIRKLNFVNSVGDSNTQICYWSGWVNLYNLHFRCENARYAIHIESANCANSEMYMENCILEYAKCNMPSWRTSADALGCGAYNNQRVKCKNSKFYGIGSGFAVHSNTMPKELPFIYEFENCLFYGDTQDVRIGEFGQNNDMVTFTNCRFVNNTALFGMTYGKTDNWDKLIPLIAMPSDVAITCTSPIYTFVTKGGARVTGGTAFNDIVFSNVKVGSKYVGLRIINDYIADIPNFNEGHLGNYHFALGNRLGDCSINSKTLAFDINGVQKTVVFNQKYSNGESVAPLIPDTDILSYINTELDGDYVELSIDTIDVLNSINI